LLLWALISSATACKKEKAAVQDAPVSPTTGTRTQFTLDSIYLYSKQVYLWSDVLSNYDQFNPRGYTTESSDLANFKKELFIISQLKVNPASGLPFEHTATSGLSKYAYLENGNNKGILAASGNLNQAAVLKTAQIKTGGKQIAYLAMGSFPVLNNSKAAIDNAFASLSAANPTYLVIDLRSNGGGYVETAAYVANLVAGTALNGKVMYSEQYNSLVQSGKAPILKKQLYYDSQGKTILLNGKNATMADVDFTEAGNTSLFSKKGTMESITDIYFIVSAQTASASELLISVLKPYFKVYLIGEKTYGKPVGSFPINIDTYSIYIPSFILRNSKGWSDYFDGMSPDIPMSMADNPVLGDPTEPCLSVALHAITTGITTHTAISSLKNNRNTTTGIAPSPVMIETRYRLKK